MSNETKKTICSYELPVIAYNFRGSKSKNPLKNTEQIQNIAYFRCRIFLKNGRDPKGSPKEIIENQRRSIQYHRRIIVFLGST